jgi:hypothetical protein
MPIYARYRAFLRRLPLKKADGTVDESYECDLAIILVACSNSTSCLLSLSLLAIAVILGRIHVIKRSGRINAANHSESSTMVMFDANTWRVLLRMWGERVTVDARGPM